MPNQLMRKQRPKARQQPRRKTPQSNSRVQRAPVATAKRIITSRPTMRTMQDSAIITHREFLCDLGGSVPFSTVDFPLNPGLVGSFPWLSRIALNYEKYVFRKLEFHYETAVSTSAGGTVMLAVDYDASDTPPLNKQTIMAYAQASRSSPWQSCKYSCRPADLKGFTGQRYVRDAAQNGDIKTFDLGTLFIGTQNTPTTGVGEIYVSYTVELITPQQTTTNAPLLVGTAGPIGLTGLTGTAGADGSDGVDNKYAIYDSTPTTAVGGMIHFPSSPVFNNAGANQSFPGFFTLPSGKYILKMNLNYAVTAPASGFLAFVTDESGSNVIHAADGVETKAAEYHYVLSHYVTSLTNFNFYVEHSAGVAGPTFQDGSILTIHRVEN
jgi:hypothetical protein